MDPNPLPGGQLPPPLIPATRLPVAILVACGGDEEGRLVMLIMDTPQGRNHYALPPENARKLIEQLEGAIRQIETGLQVVEGADAKSVLDQSAGIGPGHPMHNGRVTRPPR
jgi:hypothetical protein